MQMERPKMDSGFQFAAWLKDELRHFVDEAFDPAFVQQQGIFRQEELDQLKAILRRERTIVHESLVLPDVSTLV